MNKHVPDMNKNNSPSPDASSNTSDSPPRLPLPDLQQTADSLTRWFTPFLSNEQRAETRAALNAFVRTGGLGEQLQTKLEAFAREEKTVSWLDEYWSTRFLGRRDPSALNDNFFFLFGIGDADRARRAASLTAAVLNYKLVLDQGHIPLAVERTTPTCENQLGNLLATTRIPGTKQDRLNHYPADGAQGAAPRHIVVFCRGNIFQLDLISPQGHPHTLFDMEKGFRKIIEHCFDEQATGRAIGHLTTLPRSDWARARTHLIGESRTNRAHLEIIESALFSVHLEDLAPDDPKQACDHLLHGDSGNRWFDKSLQFIIFNEGYAGLNVEGSGLDRARIIDFLDYVLGIDPASIDQYSGATSLGPSPTRELSFDLPPEFQKKVARAASGFAKRKADFASRALVFSDYHAKLLAQKKVSPDAFAQCALQLAHFRQKKKHAATSQNISMRHYANGRVQSLWSLSAEMVEFVEIMLDEGRENVERFEALQRAAQQHQKNILACRKGSAPEQHISELLNIYNRHPEEFQTDFITRITSGGLSQQEIDKALSLFSSPGWTAMQDGAFSISFLASPSLLHQGFFPADPGNIAVGCLIHDSTMNLYLCGAKKHESLLDPLARDWHAALVELQNLLSLNLDVPDLAIDIEEDEE